MQTRHSPLSQPYESLLSLMTAETEILAAAEPLLSSRHFGAPAEIVEQLERAVSQRATTILRLSHQIFDNPELSFEEHSSAESVAGLLEDAGIEVERGSFGLPTAFRASIGRERPAVAILAEYDALPEIGHGCGHNVICASAVGAFLALSTIADLIPGSIWLIGTPAEEKGAAKELIVRAGAFDAIDAAIMAHPGTQDVGTYPPQGMRYVDVTYHGIEAHASGTPFMGRNALDAVVAAYNGIAMLRQHMLPSDRVHGVITNGGQRPNIVPSRTQATFYIRSARSSTMGELSERVDSIFRAAAEMTGTSVDIAWDPFPEESPVRTNQPLLERFAVHMKHRGRRVLQRNVMEFTMEGSTDFGNVSIKVPGIHPLVAVAPPGVAAHTREFGAYARGESGDAACLDAAFALASSAADLLWDSELRSAVADDFVRAAELDEEGAK